jgi:hypothetical protein
MRKKTGPCRRSRVEVTGHELNSSAVYSLDAHAQLATWLTLVTLWLAACLLELPSLPCTCSPSMLAYAPSPMLGPASPSPARPSP